MHSPILPSDSPATEAQLRERIAELERRLSAYESAIELRGDNAQRILDTIPVPIFVKDVEGVYRSCNVAFEHYLGRTHATIVGHTAYDIAPPHLAERYHKADIALIEQGGTQVYETNVVPANEPARDVRFHKAAYHALDGSVAGLVGIILDITDERRLAQELRAEQGLIRQFLDALPIGVLVVDAQRQPKLINRVARELFGIADDGELIDAFQTDRLRIADTDQAYPFERLPITSALRGEPGMADDLEAHLATGVVPLRTSSVPIRDAAGAIAFALVAFTDISQEKRAETALRIHEQQALVIQAQSLALQEVSTPLLAISEGIVIMPLVGAIDSQRAQQINEALLQGVSARAARVAIIDITGVGVVDTQVANALVRAAQAVRLLGAQIVLTGIRPEVAQTLVGLGVDLGTMMTCGTLQNGIVFALAQAGREARGLKPARATSSQ